MRRTTLAALLFLLGFTFLGLYFMPKEYQPAEFFYFNLGLVILGYGIMLWLINTSKGSPILKGGKSVERGKRTVILIGCFIYGFAIFVSFNATNASFRDAPLWSVLPVFHPFVWAVIYLAGASSLLIGLAFYVITPLLIQLHNSRGSLFKLPATEKAPARPQFNFKTFFQRGLFVNLFCMGLSATLNGLNLINPAWFLPNDVLEGALASNLDLAFLFETVTTFFLLLYPVSIGLWAIGWSLEDSGLILSQGTREIPQHTFRVIPVVDKFYAIMKNFTGFTAIIYYISFILNSIQTADYGRLALVFGLTIIGTLLLGPLYSVYLRCNFTKLRGRTRTMTLQEMLEQSTPVPCEPSGQAGKTA